MRTLTEEKEPSFKRTMFLMGGLAVSGIGLLAAALASGPFSDDFNGYPPGPIAGANVSAGAGADKWSVTSGTMSVAPSDGQKAAHTGPLPSSAPEPSVFRATTKENTPADAEVSFRLKSAALSGAPASPTDGVHILLRYQSPDHFYYASINRRDGGLAIGKKAPGQADTILAQAAANTHPIPLGAWQDVRAAISTGADGAVRIELYRGGAQVLSASDTGGVSIRKAGKTGLLGLNAEFYFDDFLVKEISASVKSRPAS